MMSCTDTNYNECEHNVYLKFTSKLKRIKKIVTKMEDRYWKLGGKCSNGKENKGWRSGDRRKEQGLKQNERK